MVATSINDYLTLLSASQLIQEDRLREALRALTESRGKPQSADEIGEFLIAQGLLTPWQQEQLTIKRRTQFYLGKYMLLRPLGSGGMAHVYLAEHSKMRRRVALKFLSADVAKDPVLVARFQREAQAIAAVDHPNIVRAFEIDNTASTHFLVMEYVDGPDLETLVKRDGLPDFELAADWIRQAALALDHAHQAGIVHRDMKPGNLLLGKDGVVKLSDLGVARLDTDTANLTEKQVVGTTDYLAPEQALDSHHVDARADLYSLGATLYFLLTGRPPFAGGSLAIILLKHQQEEPQSIFELRPNAPAELVELCRQLMAKRPEQRIQTAAEVAQRLADWLASRGFCRSSGETLHGDTSTTIVSDPLIAVDEDPMELAPAPVIAEPSDEALEETLYERPGPIVTIWAVAGGLGAVALLLVGGIVAWKSRDQQPSGPEQVASRSFVDPTVTWQPEISGNKSDSSSRKRRNAAKADEDSTEPPDGQTVIVGGSGGEDFRMSDAQGRPLLGIEYELGEFHGHGALSRIRPLFDRPKELPQKCELARDGYVVGGMNVAHSDSVLAVQLIYARADGMRLHPNDHYSSDWIGDAGDKTIAKLGSTGLPVVGLHGRKGAVIDALGLLLASPITQLFVYDSLDGGSGSLAEQSTGRGFVGAWEDQGWQDGPEAKSPPEGKLVRSSKDGGMALLLRPGEIQNGHANYGMLTRQLEQPLGKDGSTLYVSYRVKPTTEIGSGPYEGYGGLSLGDNDTFRVFLGYPGGNADTPWGVSKHGSREEQFMGRSEVLLRKHHRVRLVLRIDFRPGNDRMRLYVDPEGPEPETPNAGLEKIDAGQISRVAWSWSGGFRVDELRLGPTFESVTAPRVK